MCKRNMFELWMAKETAFWAVTFSGSTGLINRLAANPHLTRLSSCQRYAKVKADGSWETACRNGKEQREDFTGLERLSLDSEIVPEEKHKLLWERKIGLRLSRPLCLMPWDVMGELHLNTADPNVVLLHLFHIPKVQREDPSVTSQIQVK